MDFLRAPQRSQIGPLDKYLIGARERLPGELMLAGWVLAVTWRDCRSRLTVRVLSSLAGASLAQLRGLSVSSRRCPMATTTPSAALVPLTPVFTNTERLVLAGFLAGYGGLTRQAYELDLRQFAS
jgi:hypothetical protein